MNDGEQDRGPASRRVRLEAAMGPAVVAREGTPLREVARLMLARQVEHVVVVDSTGVVRGVVADHDLTLDRRCLRLASIQTPRLNGHWTTPSNEVEAACVAAGTLTVGEVMESRLTTAMLLEPIGIVVERMLRRDAECAVVLQDDAVVGLLGRRDLLRLLAGQPVAYLTPVSSNSSIQPPTAHLAVHNRRVLSRLLQVWR